MEVVEVWWWGSVIGFWLLDLIVIVLCELFDLVEFFGWVFDFGEGWWIVIVVIDEGVFVLVLIIVL